MLKIKKINVPCVGLAVVFMLTAWAGSTLAAEYQGFHRGARPLGMGGAFTAVADDQNALFYNPAGLSRLKGFGLGILNPHIEASENSVDLYNDFNDIDSDDSAAVADLLRQYVGENNHLKVATDIYTGFRVGNAGVMVSAIGQATTNMRVRNPVWPEAHIEAIVDYGMLVGAGMDLPWVNGLKLGATLKAITRNSLDEVYTPEIIADDNFEDIMDDDMVDGSSVSADLGLLYTTDALKVTGLNLALVAQNVPDMEFGDAVDSKTQINAGVALTQKIIGLTITEALDVHDITDNVGGDDSNEKKIHMGVEVALPYILSARAGLNQGYFTAGATLDFEIIKIDLATYGEELGAVGGQEEDRRYVAQISMGWLW